jgi:hypothetical protein
MNEWRKKNRGRYAEKDRERWMLNKYGLSVEDYNKLLEQQGGVCFICGSPPVSSTYVGNRAGTIYTATRTLLHIDHDHDTGKVRGLLCPNCNKGLGWYEKHNERAKEYLISST